MRVFCITAQIMKLCLIKHSTCDKPHLISILECINLSDEVTSQEIDVLIREAVPVAVVIGASRLTGLMLSFLITLSSAFSSNERSLTSGGT